MILRRSEARAPLALRSISVAYRGVPALWDVSWEAREGSMTAIVGPNGAGKSSLLNAAIGALPPRRRGVLLGSVLRQCPQPGGLRTPA